MDTIKREYVKVSFNFPKSVYDLLREGVPARSRSAYVAKKIEEDLKKKGLAVAIESSRGVLKNVDIDNWETHESTLKWIRKRRNLDIAKPQK